MHYEYFGLAVPASEVIEEMNRLGAEGWRVLEARPLYVNGLAELGDDAEILVLFERRVTGP